MKKTTLPIAILLMVFVAGLSACVGSSNATVALPEVVTADVIIDPTSTSATGGGFVSNGATFSACGVCYSTTNQNPTIADTKTSDPLTLFTYTSSLTGLSLNTTYYVRAYATSTAGTGYGNVVKFTTGSADKSAAFGQVSTFAGTVTPGFTNGTGTSALFNTPMGMVTDAAGNLYVTDSFNSSIRKITPSGVVTTVAGTGALGYVDGAAGTAQFYSPSGLAIDAAGNLFVADRGNNIIRKITPAGVVSTFAGSGTEGYTNGTGTAASFNTPSGLAFDATGNLYVADFGNNLVRMITPAGVVTTVAGSRTAGIANGVGTAANLYKPTGVAIDAAGNIYITEPYNNAIRKIAASTYLVTTFAGGPTATALLGSPYALQIDATGNFYIADFNGRILKIDANKILTVLAGTAGTTGATDGAGGSALFNNPQGIATDASGNIYVADAANNTIRKIKQ